MRRIPFSYYATITGSLAIAVGLVVVSYGHIRTFAIEAGSAPWEAAVIAVTVDALVVLSIAAIGHARGVGQTPPGMAKVALVVGIVATTGANVHHGLGYGWAGIVVSLWVPVAAELAYQLAMSAVRVGAHGDHEEEACPVICGGRTVGVATVMSRVSDARAMAEEKARREAAVMAARPVICGRLVSVATLAGTLPVAAPDTRPVICGHTVPVSVLVATLPVVEEAHHLVICGPVIDVATLVASMPTAPVAEERPVICGQTVTVAVLSAPLSDDRPVICGGRLVSVAEVLAHTSVVAPPVATPADTADVTTPTPVATGNREEAVMDWLTDPATEVTVDTAKGADIVALLLDAGHGRVSERTGRRILATVRAALVEDTVAA